jgi:hypothetical protein
MDLSSVREYFVYATRGMGDRGQTRISVRKDRVARAELSIEREVDTTVSSRPIRTFTPSHSAVTATQAWKSVC